MFLQQTIGDMLELRKYHHLDIAAARYTSRSELAKKVPHNKLAAQKFRYDRKRILQHQNQLQSLQQCHKTLLIDAARLSHESLLGVGSQPTFGNAPFTKLLPQGKFRKACWTQYKRAIERCLGV